MLVPDFRRLVIALLMSVSESFKWLAKVVVVKKLFAIKVKIFFSVVMIIPPVRKQ